MILPILGIWGIFLATHKQELNAIYLRVLFIVGQIVLIFQGIIGIILWTSDGWPTQGWVHIILGVIAAFVLLGVSIYVGKDTSNRAQWFYALSALILFIVALLTSWTG